MIYIEFNNLGEVQLEHHLPFDEKHGLGKTREQLEQSGLIVETLPDEELVQGKRSMLKVDIPNKNLYWDYVDVPMERDEVTLNIKALQEESKTAQQKYDELVLNSSAVEEFKTAKINILKEQCTRAIHQGFTSESTGYEFGYNDMDQVNFTKRMVTIVAGAPGPFKWKSKNAGVVELTKTEFTNVITEAEAHQLTHQERYWGLEAEVLAATTKEEVDSINW